MFAFFVRRNSASCQGCLAQNLMSKLRLATAAVNTSEHISNRAYQLQTECPLRSSSLCVQVASQWPGTRTAWQKLYRESMYTQYVQRMLGDAYITDIVSNCCIHIHAVLD